ncbi:MAG: InlB B-repeat-containing protein, partial [Bacilli bacterium]|nr:InlB B-repeat-containing protein [Bacilli bacterium]
MEKARSLMGMVFLLVISIFIFSGCNFGSSPVEFTLYFDSNGGSIVENVIYDGVNEITMPENPSKEGFIFDGWYADEIFTQAFDFTAMPAEDITVYAKWNINSYTLQYVDEDNTVLSTEAIEFNADLSTIVPPVTTKLGYTFTGWDISLPLTMPAANVTLKAQYEINQYTITFETNEGSSVEALTQDYNTTIIAPEEPKREGHTFGGWYADEIFTQAFDFTAMPAEDITVYAKWNINSYTLQYVDEDN